MFPKELFKRPSMHRGTTPKVHLGTLGVFSLNESAALRPNGCIPRRPLWLNDKKPRSWHRCGKKRAPGRSTCNFEEAPCLMGLLGFVCGIPVFEQAWVFISLDVPEVTSCLHEALIPRLRRFRQRCHHFRIHRVSGFGLEGQ